MLYKKELLTVEVPTAPKIPKSRKGVGYSGTAKIVNLKRSGRVLCVDFFDKRKTHLRRCFSDGNSYQVYDVPAGQWTLKKFIAEWYATTPCHGSEAEEKNARRFLFPHSRYGADGLIEITDRFITNKARESRQRAEDNKWARLEADMALFKEYPAGLDDFVYDNIFPNHIVIGKHDGKKRKAVCARCGGKFSIDKKFKHKDEYICPKCGRKSTLYEKRYISNCKVLKSSDGVFVAQKVGDVTLLRWAHIEYYLFGNGTQCLLYEDDNREVIRGDKVKTYFYKNIYPYGLIWRESRYGRYSRTAWTYPDTLKEVFGDTVGHIDLAETAESGHKMNVIALVENLLTYPASEYLVKMGLVRLASELTREELNGNGWNEIIGISKSYLPLLRKYDVSANELRLLRRVTTYISEQSFEKMRTLGINMYDGTQKFDRLLGLMSFEKMVNYFTKIWKTHKHISFSHAAQWYLDYIDMADNLGIDLSRKGVRYPLKLKTTHDELAKRFNEVKEKIEAENMARATASLRRIIGTHHKNGLMIVLPERVEDFIREGQSLSHCVGNGTYFKKHLQGREIILFIRKEDAPDTPYVTMQVDLSRMYIEQIYGYADKAPDIRVRRFAENFVDELKKSVKHGAELTAASA